MKTHEWDWESLTLEGLESRHSFELTCQVKFLFIFATLFFYDFIIKDISNHYKAV